MPDTVVAVRDAATVAFPDGCRDLAAALDLADGLGRRAADVVAYADVCHVRLGRLGLTADGSAAVARRLFDAFHRRVAEDSPLGFRQVWKKPHVVIPAEAPSADRVMLPHHDGGSITRLETPASTRELELVERKAYAGFLVIDAGAVAATTTFYPMVPMIRCAAPGSGPDDATGLAGVCAWYDGNVLAFAEAARRYGLEGRYLTLPRALGTRTRELIAIDRNLGHEDVTADELRSFPELERWRRECPCGTCQGELTRIYCHGLAEATGRSWPQIRAGFETSLLAERGDLVLWNNVFLQHGALGGGANRTLMHAYLVSQGSGPEYAQWAAGHWARQWDSAAWQPGVPAIHHSEGTR